MGYQNKEALIVQPILESFPILTEYQLGRATVVLSELNELDNQTDSQPELPLAYGSAPELPGLEIAA